MKCMIPGSNIKVFGRSIHCLSKIGEDLYIEPLDHGLALRTVNSSRSAYACFLFAPSFFLSYINGTYNQQETNQEEEDSFRCRITMKSCLTVFKSLYTLEKTVDKCQVYIDLKDCRLVFLLHCKHGIVKTHNLTYQETETLQAVFSKDLCPNHIVANSKALIDVVSGFQTSQEEITLSVTPQQVSFKNYVEDEPDPNKVVHSEMFLSPSEFDDYTVGIDAEVTFCLKELRAVLSFADAAGLPMSLHFESTGKPIVFAMESEQTLEATFVLATLADLPSSQSSTQHRVPAASQHTAVNHTSHTHSLTKQRKQAVNNSSSRSHSNQADDRREFRKTKPPNTKRQNEMDFPDDLNNQRETSHCRQPGSDRMKDIDAEFEHQDRVQARGPSSPIIPLHSHVHRASEHQTRPALFPEIKAAPKDNDRATQITQCVQPNRTVLARYEEPCDEEHRVNAKQQTGVVAPDDQCVDSANVSDSEDYDFVPGTPPSKKFKSMFFGASQQLSQSLETAQKSSAVVLCEDTDEEDSD
ncbi:cell cycle checkpoint control protein RAD9A-like [Patiria miniata]|uniref:Cell cycle checkpoint control protein RAD9A n=1 Tax=Patiria miniata TaxID=46514 RepID=A0A913ZTI9_PATMI|nr:cell cycle checkpoint control protein RAD9A-like [Patiria miniata]